MGEESSSSLHRKRGFPFRISSVNVTKPQFPAGIVLFAEEILIGKLHFLCGGSGEKGKSRSKCCTRDRKINSSNTIGHPPWHRNPASLRAS